MIWLSCFTSSVRDALVPCQLIGVFFAFELVLDDHGKAVRLANEDVNVLPFTPHFRRQIPDIDVYRRDRLIRDAIERIAGWLSGKITEAMIALRVQQVSEKIGVPKLVPYELQSLKQIEPAQL